MIQKLFAYLEGKTYLISLSIAICFLENCSISRGENERRVAVASTASEYPLADF